MPFDRTAGYLKDILSNIEYAEEFLGSATEHELEADRLRLYAVIRCLEIISEASRRLDEDFKLKHSEVDWRAIAGAGNVYRHDYQGLRTGEIWKTAKVALPILRAAVTRELSA